MKEVTVLIDVELWNAVTPESQFRAFVSYYKALVFKEGQFDRILDFRTYANHSELELIASEEGIRHALAVKALGLNQLEALNFLLEDPKYWDKHSQYALKQLHSLKEN